jgi:hypothetical protein
MLKNIIIFILFILVALFWLGADSLEEEEFDDPNSVIIEYRCNTLDEYEVVPPEVVRECMSRFELTKNRV